MKRQLEWLGQVVGLVVCLMTASCRANQSAHSTHQLDSALHHYDILHVNDIDHTPSADHLSHSVTLRALDKDFHMVLEWDRNILTKDFAMYSVDGKGQRQQHDIDRHAFLRGHLEGEKESSMIAAHLPASGVLTAVISTPTDTYHIEPSQHYIKEPHPFHMVAYARSHVKNRLNATQFDYIIPPILPQDQHRSFSKDSNPTRPVANRLRRQTGNIRGNTCNMILVADFSAFTMFGGMESAASQMVMVLSAVDKMIYRDTNWIVGLDDEDVVGELGVSAQVIEVRIAPDPNSMSYNRDDTNSEAGAILGLMRFGPWRDFCLAHLFTNRNFPSGLLGLANIASPVEGQTGGICSREFMDFSFEPPQTIIYNTGLSTYNNDGEQMVLSEMIRVVGHELGHNWGSHHDPNTGECGDRFLMNEFAQDGSRDSHMVFSPCSRRSIGEVLINKGACFAQPGSVCGDFRVSGEETCDAGDMGDNCCSTNCKLEGNRCSDVNSLCCVGCRAANQSTICRTAPRLTFDCTADTLCNGVDFTCPDTPEAAVNGTRCINGVCLLTADSPDTTECVPLCQTIELTNCTCGGDNECMVCCIGGDQECRPAPLPGGPESLANGSPCQTGVCRDGECSRLSQDQVTRIWNIISSLDASAFKQFLDENIVGFTLIFSIPVWCFGSCLLYWLVDYPKKKRFEDLIDKEGIGAYFRRPPGKKSSDHQPLLAEERTAVEEPEDDLPPPEYRNVLAAVRHMN